MASKFAQIWIQLIRAVGELYCKRRCAKHASLIWTIWKATENKVGQAGSRRHCGSHSSVASSIGPEYRMSHTAFDWYKNQWPRVTWNGVMTTDPRYLCGSWAFRSYMHMSSMRLRLNMMMKLDSCSRYMLSCAVDTSCRKRVEVQVTEPAARVIVCRIYN